MFIRKLEKWQLLGLAITLLLALAACGGSDEGEGTEESGFFESVVATAAHDEDFEDEVERASADFPLTGYNVAAHGVIASVLASTEKVGTGELNTRDVTLQLINARELLAAARAKQFEYFEEWQLVDTFGNSIIAIVDEELAAAVDVRTNEKFEEAVFELDERWAEDDAFLQEQIDELWVVIPDGAFQIDGFAFLAFTVIEDLTILEGRLSVGDVTAEELVIQARTWQSLLVRGYEVEIELLDLERERLRQEADVPGVSNDAVAAAQASIDDRHAEVMQALSELMVQVNEAVNKHITPLENSLDQGNSGTNG